MSSASDSIVLLASSRDLAAVSSDAATMERPSKIEVFRNSLTIV